MPWKIKSHALTAKELSESTVYNADQTMKSVGKEGLIGAKVLHIPYSYETSTKIASVTASVSKFYNRVVHQIRPPFIFLCLQRWWMKIHRVTCVRIYFQLITLNLVVMWSSLFVFSLLSVLFAAAILLSLYLIYPNENLIDLFSIEKRQGIDGELKVKAAEASSSVTSAVNEKWCSYLCSSIKVPAKRWDT